jgi:hypothetical protein
VRHQILGGNLGGRDQGPVGERHPHPLRLRGTSRPEVLTVGAGGLVAGSAYLAGVVGGEERPDDELARFHSGDRRADLLHDAGVLVTHWTWPVQRLDPAVRPQIRPADAARRRPDDRVGWFQDLRFVDILNPDVARGVHHNTTHNNLLGTSRRHDLRAQLSDAPASYQGRRWRPRLLAKLIPSRVGSPYRYVY